MGDRSAPERDAAKVSHACGFSSSGAGHPPDHVVHHDRGHRVGTEVFPQTVGTDHEPAAI